MLKGAPFSPRGLCRTRVAERPYACAFFAYTTERILNEGWEYAAANAQLLMISLAASIPAVVLALLVKRLRSQPAVAQCGPGAG